MHLLDESATCCGHHDSRTGARAREFANDGSGYITGDVVGMALPQVLEANGEDKREASLCASAGQFRQGRMTGAQ
jgi:hypothetical protein